MMKWQIYFLNRKNTLHNSCNDKEDNNGEGENEGDINYQFEATVKMSAHELGKGNVSVCCKPPRYVPYKCTYVPYNGTFGASDQGQMLDV